MRDKRDREGVSGTELVKGLLGMGRLTNIKKLIDMVVEVFYAYLDIYRHISSFGNQQS